MNIGTVQRTRRALAVTTLAALMLAMGGIATPVAADRMDEAMELYTNGHYAAALRYFRTLAEEENLPEAYYNIGVMYATGRGVTQDHAAALSWYRQAADRGSEPALFSIGAMHAAGLGVRRDFAEAAVWYRKGADRGDPGAQNALGQLYDKKLGVPQDYAEAIKWFRKSANQGFAAGQYNLGFMYDKGRGIDENAAEAAKWYMRAADQGYAEAQSALAAMYDKGRGVKQDNVQAYKWFEILTLNLPPDEATERGFAIKRRDVVAKRMSPAEIARAERLAREWRPAKK